MFYCPIIDSRLILKKKKHSWGHQAMPSIVMPLGRSKAPTGFRQLPSRHGTRHIRYPQRGTCPKRVVLHVHLRRHKDGIGDFSRSHILKVGYLMIFDIRRHDETMISGIQGIQRVEDSRKLANFQPNIHSNTSDTTESFRKK